MNTYWSAIDTKWSSYDEIKHRKVVAQGWRELGDLSSLLGPAYDDNDAFVRIVQTLGDAAYTEAWWQDGDKPDRLVRRVPTVMWNLLHLEAGDLVVAIEGTDVQGVGQIAGDARETYRYEPAHEYAHTVGYPVTWVDWTEEQFGFTPTAPSRSLLGLRRLRNESDAVIEAWEQDTSAA